MNTALTIAGSDSCGGAGIQADIKTMTANGVYAMSAITALTAQNTTGVSDIYEVSPEFLQAQLKAIFEDITPDAVKIGMVSSSDLIKTIAKSLKEYNGKNIVLDLVMVATSGAKLISDDAISTLKEYLIPLATVITPNIPEAEVLSEMEIHNEEEMIKAAAVISEKYDCAVLCKGGHSINDANDLLYRNGEYKWFYGKRINNPNTHGTGCTLSSAIASNLAKGRDLDTSVEKAKEYIYQGDIFQVVLSNRLEAEYEGSLLNTYRIMRTTNPSPYMFYFSSDDMEVAGASPETLVKLENGVLHTFPLAGTRPRGKDRQEDLALEKDLLADEKECAEHNMLVDLGRNDIGKISKYGTVEVEEYMQVLRYSHVMHIGSTVRGQIRDDKTALHAVEPVLPAGTLSGAPKYRAMEIINELENNKRGIYGGAVGYLDFTGNLDTCIGIRLAYKKNGKVFVRSGAGIVADSIPEKEFQECINKAKAVVEAIKKAQQMVAYEEKENDDDTID